MSSYKTLIFSKPTYVNGASQATAAATYSFFTSGYKPARQERYIDSDVVKNHNGMFRYVYDNGPGFRSWEPFQVVCDDAFAQTLAGANASQQYANLIALWNYPGKLGMRAPDGLFGVIWSSQPLEPEFFQFPHASGASCVGYRVTIQFEEA